MRITISILLIALALKVVPTAYATANEIQNQKVDQFCQIDPSFCNGK